MVKIGEPVEAIVKFEKGRIVPLRIRWRGRVYPIKEVTGWWKSRKGRLTFFHLSLILESGDYYEVSLNTESLVWYLERVETAV
jgi:hypothetical protein